MNIAKEMWDYLKSIGFEDIPNDDERLGCQGNAPLWKFTIARDDLCVYSDLDEEDDIGVINLSKINWGFHYKNLNIHSVQDLENWLRKEYPEFYEEENNMITKDNIEAVLKHNRIDKFYVSGDCIQLDTLDSYMTVIDINHPNLISIIEAHFGKKLEPLPEPNPFDMVKVGQWVKMKIGNSQDAGKYHQRLQGEHDNLFFYNSFYRGYCASIRPDDWDLTDIRDYNPDEKIVLKVGDEVVFNHTGDVDTIAKFDYLKNRIYYAKTHDLSYFNAINSGHIRSVNGKQGKFVIPPFDFEQTLLDAGFYQDDSFICNKSRWTSSFIVFHRLNHVVNGLNPIKPTPANAKLLIDADAILNELELAK